MSYDKPQNVTLSGVWDLPFGRGRHFLAQANRFAGAVLGGWSMHYVYTYRSGNPVAGIDAVNSCGSLLVDNQTNNQWFNNDPTCYKSRPNYTLRSVPDRYPWLRQMDNSNVNLAAAKTFSVTERWKFSLRAEAFNLLNHPLYGAPTDQFHQRDLRSTPQGSAEFPDNYRSVGENYLLTLSIFRNGEAVPGIVHPLFQPGDYLSPPDRSS